MNKILYNITVGLYNLTLHLAAPFSERARKIITGRKYWIKYFKETIVSNRDEKSLWIHCASLGEFEQGRPVIEAIRKEQPGTKIFLSFFSSSGYDIKKDYPGADLIFYLPSDSAYNAELLFRSLDPNLVIFVKYEYWFHYTKIANNRSVPVISISTILRADQLFFKSYGKFYRRILHMFNWFFVQNQGTYNLLTGLGIKQAELAGDTRFDRVRQICSKPQKIEIAKIFCNNSQVMVLGSIWPGDFEVLLPTINENKNNLKYIIAPHNIRENEIQNFEKALSLKSLRYSQAAEHDPTRYEVLIIDNIGMLSSLYQYGHIAYIGGAFRGALHNILEAATFGLPIIFGRHVNNTKFQEAVDLVEKGCAFQIQTSTDLDLIMEQLLSNPDETRIISETCASYVVDNSGATDKIMNYVKSILQN